MMIVLRVLRMCLTFELTEAGAQLYSAASATEENGIEQRVLLHFGGDKSRPNE
jgi:hypothetical protein